MRLNNISATIPNGSSTSGVIDTSLAAHPIRIILPATIQGDTIGFLVSPDGNTFRTMKHAGEAVSFTVAAGEDHGLDPAKFAGVRFMKLKLFTGAVAQNQSQDTVFEVITRLF